MTSPLPHPTRLLVMGSSLVVMTPERHGDSGEYTFPRWIQNELHDRGRPTELDNRGVGGELTRAARKTWENAVVTGAPDVVVYGFAYYECIHLMLPQWLERHANARNWRAGPIRSRYRSWLVRPVWKALAQLQRVVDGAVRARFFARTVRRVIADYELLIRRTRQYGPGGPQVLVLGLLGPGGDAGSWFPGMSARIDAMNLALEEMVAKIGDPAVRLVPVKALSEQLDPGEDPVPDGLHYSPRMRRLIGSWIAADVEAGLPAPGPDRSAGTGPAGPVTGDNLNPLPY